MLCIFYLEGINARFPVWKTYRIYQPNTGRHAITDFKWVINAVRVLNTDKKGGIIQELLLNAASHKEVIRGSEWCLRTTIIGSG